MKFKSALVTQASGSVGGATFAHNAGGLYIRARSIPVNPNTAAQQAARTALSALAGHWGGTLTAAQRAAWETYALNTPVTDAFGDPLVLSGQQMYIRCNTPRVRAGIARVDAGPTTFGLPSTGELSLTSIEAAGNITIAIGGTPDWAAAADNFLIVQESQDFSPARNFFRGPYIYSGQAEGNATPITSYDVDTVHEHTAGNKAAVRAVLTGSDGRLSAAFEASIVVIAAV